VSAPTLALRAASLSAQLAASMPALSSTMKRSSARRELRGLLRLYSCSYQILDPWVRVNYCLRNDAAAKYTL